jgi:SET family sugar efflux transporter-like MFS transporter
VSSVTSSARRIVLLLLAGVLLLGFADSMAGPYLVLFGADEARLSPFQIGVFVSVTAVSGMAISSWLAAATTARRAAAPRCSR